MSGAENPNAAAVLTLDLDTKLVDTKLLALEQKLGSLGSKQAAQVGSSDQLVRLSASLKEAKSEAETAGKQIKALEEKLASAAAVSKGLTQSVQGVDRTLKALSVNSLEAGRFLSQNLGSTVKQFDAISNAARATSGNVKNAVAALSVNFSASSGLSEYYTKLQQVSSLVATVQQSEARAQSAMAQARQQAVAAITRENTELKKLSASYAGLEAQGIRASALASVKQFEAISNAARATSGSVKNAVAALNVDYSGSSGLRAYYTQMQQVSGLVEAARQSEIRAQGGMAQARQQAIAALTRENVEVKKLATYYAALEAQSARSAALNTVKQFDAISTAARATTGNVKNAVAALTMDYSGASGLRSYYQGLESSGKSLVETNTKLVDGKKRVAGATRDLTTHTHAATLAQDALHSAARGVSGVMGGLWLTYARMLPVLIGVAAATKAVKDSVGGGLDVGFATQFAAILQTENMLGKGQTDAYNNLTSLRNDIRRSLIDISRESVFTVEENAKALQSLSLAGVSAQKGLELLTTASNVAVLAQTDLQQSTTMVLDTLYNFGMASESSITMADNYAKAADIMAYTANTVNASFTDIARSFENITGVAGTFNVTIEEASALLQSLAKTGIRGPKAGTYVRNFMDDLLGAPISQRAEKELSGTLKMDRYNADVYGEGDFGAARYIDELVESLSKLDFVEQQNTIRAITNQRSRRVLRQELIEYNKGLKEVNGELEQTNSLYDRTVKLQADAQGSLTRMAEGLTGDTKYQFIMAQSAYNAAANEAYLSAEPALKDAAQSLQTLFRSEEFQELVTSMVSGFASMAKSAAAFTAEAMSLTKYLDGLGDTLGTVAKYAAALGGAILLVKGYAAAAATIAGLGGAAAAAAKGVQLLNLAMRANPAVAVGVALVTTLVYLDQWYEKSKKYEQSIAGRQARIAELRKEEEKYEAQLKRQQEGNQGWFDSLDPGKKLAEIRAEMQGLVEGIAADMNVAMDNVTFQNAFDKILNETDTFLDGMRNAARQAGTDFEVEYRNKLVRSIEDAQTTLQAYANTVSSLDQSTEAGKQFAAYMTAWLSGIAERAMIAGEELGRLNLVLSNAALKKAGEGLEFGVKDLSQLEAANDELTKSVRALELGEEGLFLYRQEQKKTQLASLENAYAALEFAYSMATAAGAPLAVLQNMQAEMVATAITMSRLTDNIALSEKERELQPPKRAPRTDRDPIRAQLEEARTALQEFRTAYNETVGGIKDNVSDLVIGPLAAYEQSMAAAAKAYDGMFAAINKAKGVAGANKTELQKLSTEEAKIMAEANKETKRLVDEYRAILDKRSEGLEALEIQVGKRTLSAAESWLRDYAGKYGEIVTQIQNDLATLDAALKTTQSQEEAEALRKKIAELEAQLRRFVEAASLGAWAADLEEAFKKGQDSIALFDKELQVLAEKSKNEGLFGVLLGNADNFERSRNAQLTKIRAEIARIQAEIGRSEGEMRVKLVAQLDELGVQLEKATQEVDPTLKEWGDSFGDYLANGIVYGFDKGESPAKAFGNYLKAQIVQSIAQALSKQFVLALTVGMGGGGASNLAGSVGGGSSGGLGGINPLSMLGGNSIGMGFSNAATWLSQSSMLAGTGAGNYLTGFAGNAAGMSNLALGGAGILGGLGADLLFGGKGYASTGGSLGATIGMMTPLGPLGAAIGSVLGGALGSLLGGGKPSDKTSWATIDPTTNALSDVGNMGGKKDPGKEQMDATTQLAQLIGGFANLAGINSSLTTMIGGRDGTRLRINRAEGTQGFRTPEAGLANGNNSLNYGSGEEAIKKMLNDLVDEGTLSSAVINQWRSMKTDLNGASRDAVELISLLNLITQGYDRMTIERGNLLQAEGESLDAAVARVLQIQKALSTTALPGDDLARGAEAFVNRLRDLGANHIPTTAAEFGKIVDALDLSSAAGRTLYTQLMNLAPAFLEIQAAQQGYYQMLLTDEQRLAEAKQALSKAFGQLKVAEPADLAGYKQLVDSINATTASGAALKAQLLALVPAFIEISDAAKELEQSRIEAIKSAEDELRAAYKVQASEIESTVKKLLDFSGSLRKFRGELLTGPMTTLNPVQQYQQTRNEFESTALKAQAGDEEAMASLQSVAKAFLDSSRTVFASGTEYALDFNEVMAVLKGTEIIASSEAEKAQTSLDLMKTNVSKLVDIDNSVISVKEAIDNLLAAIQANTQIAPSPPAVTAPSVDYDTVFDYSRVASPSYNAPVASSQQTNSFRSVVSALSSLREEVVGLREQQAKEHRESVISNYDAADRSAERIGVLQFETQRRINTLERYTR